MTTRFATLAELLDGDVIVESWTKGVPDALNFLTVSGANLAAVGANNTLTITSEIHYVTLAGSWTVDNITDALGASLGEQVRLIFQNAGTVRNNGGGAGNIRTRSGGDRAVIAGEQVTLIYDGTHWITGDAPSIAFSQIYDSTLAAPAASFDIQNIAQTGNHLRLVGFFHGDTGSSLTVRFNNDSGANYDWHGFRVDNASATADSSTGQTAMQLGSYPDATDGDAATDFSSFELVIPNYRDATNHKACVAVSAARTTSGSTRRILHRAGYWFAAGAAISRITVLAATNFVVASRATLYLET